MKKNEDPFLFGSVCSGIEAASVAWEPLGWRPAWFSEIEPFPCKLLSHRFPKVENLGDMRYITEKQTFKNAIIDLLVGGTPCQSFSFAGLRTGLDSENGNLALEYCRILKAKQPKWFVWENVPGVFTSFSDEKESKEARDWETSDFATLLLAFRECGYSCAWRVLDAQYFGVPQRRRRVFVVGYLGKDWRPPAAVLFESESLCWDITPKQKGKTVKNANANFRTDRVTPPLDAAFSKKLGVDNQSIKQNLPFLVPCWWDGGQISQTLDAVLYKGQTMPKKNRFPAIITDNMEIRRLTPLECERLQGFPDNWTNIPGSKNGPRYKALGNSKAIPVVRWIGKRIQIIDKMIKEKDGSI